MRPSEPHAAALVDRLMEVRRALLHDVPARDPREVHVDRVRVLDRNPPCFCLTERLEGGEVSTVTLPVTLDPAFPTRPVCDLCATPCAHGLTAIDELLEWLYDPHHPRRDEVLAVAHETPWRRWLGALDDALEALETDAARRTAARLWWSVDLEAKTLAPFVEHMKRSGARSKPKRLRLEVVETEVRLGAADRAALAAARLLRAERRAAAREGREDEAFLRALGALVDHSRVCVGTPGGTPWRIEQAPVRFTVHQDDHGVELEVRAGEIELKPSDLSVGRGPRTVLIPHSESKRLQLVHIEAPLARLLSQWAKNAVPVPAPAQGELMARLSRAAQHLEVQAADLVAELTVPARLDLVALLTPLPQGGLQIELRIRPLPNGPLFGPALGPEQVLTSTPDRQILRATRDLWAEREAARAAFEDLELPEDPTRPLTAAIEDRAAAVEAAERLRADPRIECQWPEQEWYPPISVGTERLNLAVRTKRDWFDVRGGVHIDGKRVELAVLLEAARRDRGYVALDDGRFLKLKSKLRSELLELAPFLERRRGGLRVSLAALDRVRALGDQAESYAPSDEWQALSARMDAAADLEPEVPAHLQDVLRPYQRDGFVWMSRLAAWGAGSVLADDMGLGKTVQAIALMCARAELGPQLVIAPTSVGFNWRRELARFAPDLEVVPYAGPGRLPRLERAGPGVVFVTSYGVVLRDVEPLGQQPWATLVLDEAHAIKNPRSHRARAVRALRAEATVALTGTPVENHPAEMWALFEAVFPGLLGSWESFRSRFLATAERDGSAFGTGALAEVIRPYVLRRTKAQVAQHLPPRTESTVDVTLSTRERALYDDARLSAVAEMGKREVTEQTHLHLKVLAALTRLRQLACHPRLVDEGSRVPSSKHERLMQILHDLIEEGRRALVFSQFTRHLALVREALDGLEIPYRYLDGSTPAAQRAVEVDAFQDGDEPIFLISTKAGGVGLNLTAADTVIHLDPWWNPATEDQATDRAHRIGQTQPVTILRLVARDTIEHHMLEMNRDKRRLVTDLLDGTEQVAKMTSAELMALIRR